MWLLLFCLLLLNIMYQSVLITLVPKQKQHKQQQKRKKNWMELLQMFGLEQTGILTGSGCVHLYQSEEDLNWVIYIYTSSWKRMSDIPVLGKEWVIYQFLEKNEWYASSWKRMSDIYQFLEKNEWYIPVLEKEWMIYLFLEKNEWYIPVLGKEWVIYQFLEEKCVFSVKEWLP